MEGTVGTPWHNMPSTQEEEAEITAMINLNVKVVFS